MFEDFHFGPHILLHSSTYSLPVFKPSTNNKRIVLREVWPRHDHDGLPCNCYSNRDDCTTCSSTLRTELEHSSQQSLVNFISPSDQSTSNSPPPFEAHSRRELLAEIEAVAALIGEKSSEMGLLVRSLQKPATLEVLDGEDESFLESCSDDERISVSDLVEFLIEGITEVKRATEGQNDDVFANSRAFLDQRTFNGIHHLEGENRIKQIELRMDAERRMNSLFSQRLAKIFSMDFEIDEILKYLRSETTTFESRAQITQRAVEDLATMSRTCDALLHRLSSLAIQTERPQQSHSRHRTSSTSSRVSTATSTATAIAKPWVAHTGIVRAMTGAQKTDSDVSTCRSFDKDLLGTSQSQRGSSVELL